MTKNFTGDGSQEIFHCYICVVFEWRGMRFTLIVNLMDYFFIRQLLHQSSSPSNTVSLYERHEPVPGLFLPNNRMFRFLATAV